MSAWVLFSLLGVLAAALVTAAVYILLGRRFAPAMTERRRLRWLERRGRVASAEIDSLEGDLLHYTYTIGRVVYHSSQDVSALRHLLPQDPKHLTGPGSAKYLPEKPVSSMVITENWSGLPIRRDSPDDGTFPSSSK